jgi:hypothetical protein
MNKFAEIAEMGVRVVSTKKAKYAAKAKAKRAEKARALAKRDTVADLLAPIDVADLLAPIDADVLAETETDDFDTEVDAIIRAERTLAERESIAETETETKESLQ